MDEKEYQRNYYLRTKEAKRQYKKGYYQRLKEEVLSHYSITSYPMCAHCGINDIDVLTIDHIWGGGSKHRRIVGTGRTFYIWLRKNDYPAGHQVLCASCNLKKRIQGDTPYIVGNREAK